MRFLVLRRSIQDFLGNYIRSYLSGLTPAAGLAAGRLTMRQLVRRGHWLSLPDGYNPKRFLSLSARLRLLNVLYVAMPTKPMQNTPATIVVGDVIPRVAKSEKNALKAADASTTDIEC